MSATEVSEDVSSATVRTRSSGILLTSRIDRTSFRAAIATSGTIKRSGVVAYAAAGMMPMSALPSARASAQADGMV